jgi:hypothetical protein
VVIFISLNCNSGEDS